MANLHLNRNQQKEIGMAEATQELDGQEEVDVFSLLSAQGKADGNEDGEEDGDSEPEGGLPDDPKQLRELLLREREIKAKRNKRLKIEKQTIARMQKENEAFSNRINELEKRFQTNQPDSREAEKTEQQVREWQERVADDPSQSIAYADWKQSMLEDKLAKYLGGTIQKLEQKIESLRTELNPERKEYGAEVEQLRQNEMFASLPDEALLAIAKGLKSAKVKTPRGSVGGRKPQRVEATKGYVLTDEDRERMGF
jgi:predicted RNase H-like nuclease (RuvC/YqgF family)